MRTTKVMQDALADMKSGELALFGTGVGFDEYQELVGFNRWAEVEAQFAPSEVADSTKLRADWCTPGAGLWSAHLTL